MRHSQLEYILTKYTEINAKVYSRARVRETLSRGFAADFGIAAEERLLSEEPATPINANQIETRGYVARSQINRIKGS